jgi:hypothetical protein
MCLCTYACIMSSVISCIMVGGDIFTAQVIVCMSMLNISLHYEHRID